jgi:hypothetical protein
MIVASMFEGDDDTHLMWLQHDVYHDALGIITANVKTLHNFVMQYTKSELVAFSETYDHRRLQGAHDIWAAQYRFYKGDAQIPLPLNGETQPDAFDKAVVDNWRAWLKETCRDLVYDPYVARLICNLGMQSDSELANNWEAHLSFLLLEPLDSIPWKAHVRPKGEFIWQPTLPSRNSNI